MTRLERLFAPQWAGPWTVTRILFCGAAAHGQIHRFLHLQDVGRSGGMVFNVPNFGIDTPPLSLPAAYVMWALACLGILLLLRGGKWARTGLGLYGLGYFTTVLGLGLSFRAPERLTAWMVLALAAAPIHESGLAGKARSPFPRWILLCCFVGMYGSTGLLKAMSPGWWSGETLSLALLELHMGGRLLGTWIGQWPSVILVMSWWTILFECLFPFLVFVRRANPYVLAAGIFFHLGSALFLHVGPLTWISLAAYPVLLHPEVARKFWCNGLRRGGAH